MRRPIALSTAVLTALLGPLATQSQAAEGFTVDKVGYVRGNLVRATGTVTCPEGTSFNVSLNVYQRSGRFQANGWGWASGSCTGSPESFTVDLENPSSVAFRRGLASVSGSASAYICHYDEEDDYYYCDDVQLGRIDQQVRMR